MSSNKDRKDFNKLNINRDIEEKPAARGRGRPKGAKNRVKKPIKVAKGLPVHEAKHKQPKADKITQGAEAKKHAETRREEVERQLKASEYIIPVIQEVASIGIQGELDVKDIVGVLGVELRCARIDWGVVNRPLIDMFVRDYVLYPVYLQEGRPPVAMRLVHKRHVDLSASDPAWSNIESAAR